MWHLHKLIFQFISIYLALCHLYVDVCYLMYSALCLIQFWFFLFDYLIVIIIFVVAHLQVEAGDVIVRVNGTDVHHFTTKEGMQRIY